MIDAIDIVDLLTATLKTATMRIVTENHLSKPRMTWVLFGLGIAGMPLALLLAEVFEDPQFLWLIGLSWTLLISAVVVDRTQTRCFHCGGKIDRDVILIEKEDVESFIEKHQIKKPRFFRFLMQGKGVWACSVAVCRKCEYQQVSGIGPYDPGA